ncbi:uridine/cytidine kinase [Pseudothermotoga hypogea DSM 11164 = NBRC 106472]|uniref:Uridine kinase n=3 Tax=Pseudothermotoga TaxID=1643951 RepID=A0A0X1KQK6_9THEM|nr:uridine kinase [Pseudothermotoga hypogea]AJC73596.1 uridine/cytidine kinase [Pseudothermotoga hypogea DSM 11164 = NBRC 106472]MBC7121855.1 uridine kinase [Pseudothermotoga sp.]
MVLIGIGGGTGSGKTTVAKRIVHSLGEERCAILPMDNYYKDMSHLPIEERRLVNYDHPDVIEHRLLVEHLRKLLHGEAVQIPTYDFVTYTRKVETLNFVPKKVILVEGIFALYYEELRELYELSLYVDTESDIRFIRRLMRDVKERGRSVESVVNQYLRTVKPMHDAYVEPTKRYADIIVPKGGHNDRAIEVVVNYITKRLEKEV